MRVFNYSTIKNVPFRLNIFCLYFFIFEAKLSANSYPGRFFSPYQQKARSFFSYTVYSYLFHMNIIHSYASVFLHLRHKKTRSFYTNICETSEAKRF